MIEFYVIPPRKNIELSHLGDNRYFCLAQQYLKDPEYAKFFKELPDTSWVTLDNGAGDHDIITEDQLFEVMLDLMPNEVIPPDILFNGPQTIHNAIVFHERMVKENIADKIELFYCPQGRTQNEWLGSYMWGLNQPWIKTIGLSKIAVPFAFLDATGDVGIMEGRHNCFNYLKVHGLLQKPLHLLGMGDPREFNYYKLHDTTGMIRSSDSCNSIWSAVNILNWNKNQFQRIKTPANYFDLVLDQGQINLAKANITYLKWLVS